MLLSAKLFGACVINWSIASVVATVTPATTNSFIVTFDDGGPVTVGGSVTSPAVGVQKGLFYNSLKINTPGVAGTQTVGLVPHSNPNWAFSGDTERLMNGTVAISTQYTKTKFFSLQSFYFGLLLSTPQAAATVPIEGTIKVTGYQVATHKVIGPVSITFKIAPGLQVPLQYAQLPTTFKGLERVTVEKPQLDALILDDVKGTTTT